MVLSKQRRPKSKLPGWTHPPIYTLVRTLAAAAQLFPIDETVPVLRSAAGFYAGLPINRRRLGRAIDNISWCFPDWPDARVRAHAIEAYRHLFAVAAEIAATPRLMTLDAYPRHARLGNLNEGLSALLSGGPVIMITGHCGNWELLGYTLAVLGFPIHALYRPLDMKPVDDWVHDSRSRRGLTLVDKFGASHILPQVIDRGDPVGFIADQNAGERGIYVPFFGRLASTYKTIALLAIRSGAKIVCGTARRLPPNSLSPWERAGERDALDPAVLISSHDLLPQGPSPKPQAQSHAESSHFSYRIEIVDVIHPADWEKQPDAVYYITARYRRAIETMVRRAPEQYLWMHRYWKTRPLHEREGKPFPARLREKIAQLPWMTEAELSRVVERSECDTETLRQRGKLPH